jgi:hypothetical protein
VAIYLGYIIHLKVDDKFFKNGVAIITILASINFIIKAFK